MSALVENRMNNLEKRKEQIRRYELSISDDNDSTVTKINDYKKTNNLNNGEKSKIRFPDGCIFLAACTSGSTEDVDEILKTSNTDINTTNVDGLTGLHQACINEDLGMAKFLIDKNININIKDNEGWTALHAAAQSGFIDIAKLLIEKGAKLDVVNCDCELPIDLAESKEMIKLIRDAMNKQGINDAEAKSLEERMMKEDAMRWVQSKSYGGSVDEKTGATPLHVAAVKGYVDVMRLLLQSGAPIDAPDNEGWTPLHGAAHWGQTEACQLLAENNCNMKAVNNQGSTALDVADPEIISLLEELLEKQNTHNDNAKPTKSSNKRKSSITRISLEQKKGMQKKNEEDEKKAMGSVSDEDDEDEDITAEISNEEITDDNAGGGGGSVVKKSRESDKGSDDGKSIISSVIETKVSVTGIMSTAFVHATLPAPQVATITTLTTATTIPVITPFAATTTAATTATAATATAAIGTNLKERTKFEFMRNLQEKVSSLKETLRNESFENSDLLGESNGKTRESIVVSDNIEAKDSVSSSGSGSEFGVTMRRSIAREKPDIEVKRPPNLASDIFRRSDNPALWRLGFRRPSNSENNSDIDQVIKLTEAERVRKSFKADDEEGDESQIFTTTTAPLTPTTTTLASTVAATNISTTTTTTTSTSTTTNNQSITTSSLNKKNDDVEVDDGNDDDDDYDDGDDNDDKQNAVVTTATTATTHSTGSLLRPETAAALASIANSHQRISDFTRRDDANELERKMKAKKARESRRSTQGVTKEDIQKAEDSLKAAYKDPSSLLLLPAATTAAATTAATTAVETTVALASSRSGSNHIGADGDINKLATNPSTSLTALAVAATDVVAASTAATTATGRLSTTDSSSVIYGIIEKLQKNGKTQEPMTSIHKNPPDLDTDIKDINVSISPDKEEADDDGSSYKSTIGGSSRSRRKRESRRPTGKITLSSDESSCINGMDSYDGTTTSTTTPNNTTTLTTTATTTATTDMQQQHNTLINARNVSSTTTPSSPSLSASSSVSVAAATTNNATTTSVADETLLSTAVQQVTLTPATTTTTRSTSTTSSLLRNSLRQLSDSYNIAATTTTTMTTHSTTTTTLTTPMSRYSTLIQQQQQQQSFYHPSLSPRKFITPSTRWSTLTTNYQQQQKPHQTLAATTTAAAAATMATTTTATPLTRPFSHLTTFDSVPSNISKFANSSFSSNVNSVDYHKSWLEEKCTNESLRKQVSQLERDLFNAQTLLDAANHKLSLHTNSNEAFNVDAKDLKLLEMKNSELEAKLKDYYLLEKKLVNVEDELKNSKNENQKLKNENGALIRVISKLSK